MGQQIAVTEKPSPKAGVRRFEANRSLTGMGHEVFTSAADAVGPRPAAKLARDLLATGDVSGVRVYGNMITVDMKSGSSGAGLDAVVRDLYQYWKPGMELPVFDPRQFRLPDLTRLPRPPHPRDVLQRLRERLPRH